MSKLRALVVKSSGPSGGSLLHLVPEASERTMCGAFTVDKLGTAGGSESELCPACVEHWRADVVKELNATTLA